MLVWMLSVRALAAGLTCPRGLSCRKSLLIELSPIEEEDLPVVCSGSARLELRLLLTCLGPSACTCKKCECGNHQRSLLRVFVDFVYQRA